MDHSTSHSVHRLCEGVPTHFILHTRSSVTQPEVLQRASRTLELSVLMTEIVDAAQCRNVSFIPPIISYFMQYNVQFRAYEGALTCRTCSCA